MMEINGQRIEWKFTGFDLPAADLRTLRLNECEVTVDRSGDVKQVVGPTDRLPISKDEISILMNKIEGGQFPLSEREEAIMPMTLMMLKGVPEEIVEVLFRRPLI
ncbi:MAG: hypothetical protein UW39_C0008G0048 [Parcubacteria group bacterium GW2011_GWC2_44_17]|uniref:Uncharacterized protein n=1 Tax=Candidatus Jacksonbacteria bacterium RIFCSPLOWO2_02_FULL_44_20 TaxID=1798460 RepID=A0A1G2A757_9BACT|nr:MAG: hypothetical protein UW39_C0008G0048 [Parcubacteria group bacterium GW2011_GWC2_44_17]KKT50494.1 MAG: hypothetical protein UW40_C0003G0017 [Parcubacteria group bacterium GW2011_GWF2_44_17]OGY71425.1 MAG: hypothetical protein A3C00_04015 [Candidatus Jacksonbacteria bacterium RIFCSPHIGHO2_02_FULL_44_25]OGY72187.1 MAG: hypothetical protein A3E05_01320 [Candidatus Jacksonbacteria bacterium RIFCSPHIGHO2_12_FULL_44_12]OGY72306.1 MAG: hypothetical protein A3H61_00805 [Candidatus Jacksonbacteri